MVRHYTAAEELSWKGDCLENHSKISTGPKHTYVEGGSSCQSEWIYTKANSFQFDWAGFTRLSKIEIEYKSGENNTLELPIVKPPEKWKRTVVNLPSGTNAFRIKVRSDSMWMAISNTAYHVNIPKFANSIRSYFLENRAALKILYWGFAILLALTIPFLLQLKSSIGIYSLFLFTAFVVHFRAKLFYRYDEWVMLDRFYESGLGAALTPHNEHFIPLFVFLFWLEAKLFGSNYDLYTLLTIVIQSVNASLLFLLIDKLKFGRKPALLLAFLFLLSGLHSEIFQSAITQGAAIMLGLILASLLFCLMNKLIWVAICNFLAPLFFGTGFVLAPIVFIFSFLNKEISKAKLAVYLTISSLASLALYYFFREGHVNLTNPTENFIPKFAEYLYTGSLLGTTVRGLGISSAHTLAKFPDNIYLVAIVFWLVVLIYTWQTKGKGDNRFLVASFGLVFIVLALVIPALGRAVIGTQHSLTLRYQSVCLVGLFIGIAPIIGDLFEIVTKRRILAGLSFIALVFYTHSQLVLGYKFNRFWIDGYELNDVVSRMKFVSGTDVADILSYREAGNYAISTKERLPTETIRKLLPIY